MINLKESGRKRSGIIEVVTWVKLDESSRFSWAKVERSITRVQANIYIPFEPVFSVRHRKVKL